MSGDRSLDEFAAAGAGGGDSTDGSDSTDGDDAVAEGDPAVEDEGSNDVAPAESTSTWSAEGADCDRCGATVERRWRDDADLVCADCAEW
ncbi:DUF7573 domain-containing protein [Halorubrum halodurans]|uniref:DUF7573 domain-containing protein n=1 Tax=Halorubrum halodurans TaxID=1383851 RepID=A0A256IMD5_9EURY|nr:hypothetical protein [Halorubrum halodurans]OYR57456.1 hypothetical protein DJ70_05825 [Halorubrum halodurans]